MKSHPIKNPDYLLQKRPLRKRIKDIHPQRNQKILQTEALMKKKVLQNLNFGKAHYQRLMKNHRKKNLMNIFKIYFCDMEERSLYSLMRKYTLKLQKALSTSCSLSGLSLEIKIQLLFRYQMLWKLVGAVENTLLRPLCVSSAACLQLCSICSSLEDGASALEISLFLCFVGLFFTDSYLFPFASVS